MRTLYCWLKSRGSQKPLQCWVDATPSRIAVLVGKSYKVFRANGGQDINWKETVALELLGQTLISLGHSGPVTVHSDSSTALHVFKGLKCRSPGVTESAQRLRKAIAGSGFKVQAIHVSGKKNPADPLSRGRYPDGFKKIEGPVVIPKALRKSVTVE
jgi:hypothetical protein